MEIDLTECTVLKYLGANAPFLRVSGIHPVIGGLFHSLSGERENHRGAFKMRYLHFCLEVHC